MKVLVYYVDFHWDNVQGGSGKSFDMRVSFDISDDLRAGDLREHISGKLDQHVQNQRPFMQVGRPVSIIRIEIV